MWRSIWDNVHGVVIVDKTTNLICRLMGCQQVDSTGLGCTGALVILNSASTLRSMVKQGSACSIWIFDVKLPGTSDSFVNHLVDCGICFVR